MPDVDVSTASYWAGIRPIVEVEDAIDLTYEALIMVVVFVAVVVRELPFECS